MLEVKKFIRKSFEVDGVRVTENNLEDVAKWCGGDVRTDKQDRQYVKVRVVRPLNARQSEAYVNDFVLYAGTGYKVYTPKAFEDAFEEASSPPILYTNEDELIAVQEQDDEPLEQVEPLQPYTGDTMNPFPHG